jgi:hypothetical protein
MEHVRQSARTPPSQIGVLQQLQQTFHLVALKQVSIRAAPHGLGQGLSLITACEHDDWNAGEKRLLANPAQDSQARHIRNVQIQNYHAWQWVRFAVGEWPFPVQIPECLISVSHDLHSDRNGACLKRISEQQGIILVILNEKYGGYASHSESSLLADGRNLPYQGAEANEIVCKTRAAGHLRAERQAFR